MLQRLPDLRPMLVAALTVVIVGGLGAQATFTAELVLPKGTAGTEFEVAIPLAEGQSAELTGAAFAKTSPGGASEALGDQLQCEVAGTLVGFAARRPYLFVYVKALREDTSAELTVAATLEYTLASTALQARSGPVEPTESVLRAGKIVKVAIDEDGVFVIDAAFLKDAGLSPDAGPGAVRVYTKGGAMLPERVGADYPTDLREVGLIEQGNGNARWDGGERLLFFGEGEDTWRWNAKELGWDRTENLYAEETYYYIAVGGEGLRVQTRANVSAPRYDDAYTFRARWEEDKANLLAFSADENTGGQGSGQPWYGDRLDGERVLARPGLWDLGEVPAGAIGRLKSELWAASNTSSSYSVEVNGQGFRSNTISSAGWGNPNYPLAYLGAINAEISLSKGGVDVGVLYPGSPRLQRGWIDYVQLNHPARLIYRDKPFRFQSAEHLSAGTWGYSLRGGGQELAIIDVSDAMRPAIVTPVLQGGELTFGYRREGDGPPSEFYAFASKGDFARPRVIGAVRNTDLHGVAKADMMIVYGEGLQAAAEKLAKHRRDYNGYAVTAASMADVAEEFGGGRIDPSSIRNLAAMLHQRDANFRYLLLLGDGTYDPRQIVEKDPSLIPTFQTKASNHEVTAFPTDDYFGLLDDGEGIVGASYPQGGVDIGVGRIPAFRLSDATAVVDKIIRYETDPKMRGDWRLRSVYVADDEDGNLHVRDVDSAAETAEGLYPQFNQAKIYVDAFEQVGGSGGQRFPAASEAISRNMFRGNLITTYLGHGGPRGWGQERFLNTPDIERWAAPNALPVLITATCTFTGYDDPTKTVIGEQVLFKRNGGVAASMSTVRPVYTNSNKALTDASLKVFLDKTLTRRYGIGELLIQAKTASVGSSAENDRKYALFGDPAMRLAVPQLDVVVTHIDDQSVEDLMTLPKVAPLREVVLRGIVRTLDSTLASNFTGKVELTVFDQQRTATTLGQDKGSSPMEFSQIGTTLFTGSSTVTDGRWEAKFMLPLDVSLAQGQGRLSLYAEANDGRDGAGVFSRFIVDGLAPPGVNDQTPPVVQAFIGDDSFSEGGVTTTNPVLFAKLSDDTGINVSGSAIGHDLTATLRGPDDVSYVINDFYQAATDDYTRGEASYPVYNLPEGSYELEVRAWDLANNTGVGRTAFIVSKDAGEGLRRVLNYPNPMVDATCFQFEHSSAGQLVDVRVDIYTTSGRLVRSLDYNGMANGPRFAGGEDCISWDGTDAFGQRLARGVYLYKVRLRTAGRDAVAESDFEKVVVLR